MKVHSMFVIGQRDSEADVIRVCAYGKGKFGAKRRSEAIAEILLAIKERRP